jgi:hypothetical protein
MKRLNKIPVGAKKEEQSKKNSKKLKKKIEYIRKERYSRQLVENYKTSQNFFKRKKKTNHSLLKNKHHYKQFPEFKILKYSLIRDSYGSKNLMKVGMYKKKPFVRNVTAKNFYKNPVRKKN